MSARRSEPPTPRRLRRARARGEIASSRELTGAAGLLAGIAALVAVGPSLAGALARAVAVALARVSEREVAAVPALLDAASLLARTALPVGGAALAGGALAGALQAQGLFTLEAVRVRLDRLHPARGLARLVSPQRLTAAAAQVLRLLVVAMVAWHLLRGEAQTLLRAPGLSPAAALRALAAGSVRMALSLAAVAAGLGALDLLLARRRHRKELMMSRDELRREQREDEGDPQRKAERRRLHRALAHASPLRRATCVVVNPTHVAVALDHPAGSDDAPVVIAKAMGRAAVRLRREARRAGVPIVRDVALARALFRLAEVGDEIPVELYEAAAAILVHLHAASGAPR